MSDKTNQATPTPKHTPGPWRISGIGKFEITSEVSKVPIVNWMGFDDSNRKTHEHWANAALIARAPSLLAENEKLRGLLTKSLELAQKVKADHGWQSAYDLCDEITAALSGEQEGTPLK